MSSSRFLCSRITHGPHWELPPSEGMQSHVCCVGSLHSQSIIQRMDSMFEETTIPRVPFSVFVSTEESEYLAW